MVTAHVKAPIQALHPDPRNFITWFSNPSMGGGMRTGYLYQIGPWPLTSPSEEEWAFACGITESDPKTFSEETILHRLRATSASATQVEGRRSGKNVSVEIQRTTRVIYIIISKTRK